MLQAGKYKCLILISIVNISRRSIYKRKPHVNSINVSYLFLTWTLWGHWQSSQNLLYIKLRFISWILLNSPWNLLLFSHSFLENPLICLVVLNFYTAIFCLLPFSFESFSMKKNGVIKSYQLFLWSIFNDLSSSIHYISGYAQGCPFPVTSVKLFSLSEPQFEFL